MEQTWELCSEITGGAKILPELLVTKVSWELQVYFM